MVLKSLYTDGFTLLLMVIQRIKKKVNYIFIV
jgi:hypothetical protein